MEQKKKNIKIAKTATGKSIMDVTANLNYRKTNSSNEDVFKGNVIFSITETASVPKKYLKAYLGKAKAKMLVYSMINLQFEEIFGLQGFTSYGGTPGETPESRILNIKMSPKKQFIFTISSGPGKVGEKGNIEMVGKPTKVVQTYLSFQEGILMAHEVYDYIRDEETKAMLEGQPLYTYTPGKPDKNQTETPSQVENKTMSKEAMREKVMKMTEAQLKQLYDKIKASKEQKEIDLKDVIVEEMKKRKQERTAG